MGVAYHANFLVWFEVGRTDLIRTLVCPYSEMESRGFYLPVLEARCQYFIPVGYDSELDLYSWLDPVTGARIRINYEVYHEETLAAQGTTTHTFVDKSRKPVRPPDFFLDKIR